LPPVEVGTAGKLAVAKTDDLTAGILVDELHDVISLRASDIGSAPSNIQSGGEFYVAGTAEHRDRIMSVLDLEKLLETEHWIVDEEVGRS